MGWISDRKMRTGSPLHSRKGAKAKGPLRKIVEVLSFAEGIFDTSYVRMECGHKGASYNTSPTAGVSRARCAECGKEAEAEEKAQREFVELNDPADRLFDENGEVID